MALTLFLGIDCGTQGTKALLVDISGNVHGRGYAKHVIIERSTGAREQDPAWWIAALTNSVREALATAPAGSQVVAIGVSGQQHGLVVLDEHATVIRPAKLWNDTETAPQNRELIHRLGGPAQCAARFGIVPLTGYTVSKLLFLAEREPENFARIHHILLPHECLNFWLTGRMAAEPGDASGTGYFDVRTRQWAPDVLAAIDGNSGQLLAALPTLINDTDLVGALRPEAATALGLPSTCVVSAGGGDNMMGAIGTGNVRPGIVTLSLGTSGTVYGFNPDAAADPTGAVAPFCSSSGGWLPLVCTMNVTNVVTATAQLLGRDVTSIDAALDSTPPGADGLVMLPFLNGERTPDLPEAHGSLHGITAVNYTSDHLLRAAVEGVTFGLLNGLDLVTAGKPTDRIHVIGGGSRSRAWRQLLADATGAEIHVPTEEEAGCLGAAMQAIVAFNTHHGTPTTFAAIAENLVHTDSSATCFPRPELRAAYSAARKQYQQQLTAQYPAAI